MTLVTHFARVYFIVVWIHIKLQTHKMIVKDTEIFSTKPSLESPADSSENEVTADSPTAAAKKKKRKKKKKKSAGATATEATPTEQTEPPTIPVRLLVKGQVYPEGEIQEYTNEYVLILLLLSQRQFVNFIIPYSTNIKHNQNYFRRKTLP